MKPEEEVCSDTGGGLKESLQRGVIPPQVTPSGRPDAYVSAADAVEADHLLFTISFKQEFASSERLLIRTFDCKLLKHNLNSQVEQDKTDLFLYVCAPENTYRKQKQKVSHI